MDKNVKVCILKVCYNEPVSGGEKWDNGVESDHLEAFGLDV